MALGIGLGSFVRGAERGIGIGRQLKADREESRQKEEFSTALDQGRADYDAAVASGEAQAGDTNALLGYSFKRAAGPLLKSGDIKGVTAINEFFKSEEARKGSEFFKSGLMKLQAGDVQGALGDLISLGKLKGYGPDFSLEQSEKLSDGRWRVKGRGPSGETFSKEISESEIADMFATHANPEAAAKLFRERRAQEDWRRTLMGDQGGYRSRLEQSESGGRADIVNDLGYAGRFQFGAPRLADLGVYKPGEGESLARWSKTRKDAGGKWSGSFNIPGHPDVKTLDDFLASDEAQQAVYDMHEGQNDADIASRGLEQYVGKKIKGVEITREGIQAMMHLGGAKGAERFLKTGGKHNPKDANGTSLLDYARMGRGSGETKVAQAPSDIMTDANPTQVAALPAAPSGGPDAALDGTLGAQPAADTRQQVAQAETETPTAGEAAAEEGGIAARFGLSKDQVEVLANLGPEEGMKELTKFAMQKNPAAVQEYEYAVSQGYEGTLIDYELEKARASSGEENSFDKAAGEGLYKFAEGELTKADESRAQLRDFEQLAVLLGDPNVYTGTGGETIASLKKLGSTLFGLEGLEGVGNAEAAKKISSAMVGKLKTALPGPMSNADRTFLEAIPPNLGDSPEGIQLAVELARETTLAAGQRAEKLHEIMEGEGGRLTMKGRLEFERWARSRPLFSQELMDQIKGAAKEKTVPRGPTAGSEKALESLRSKYGLE